MDLQCQLTDNFNEHISLLINQSEQKKLQLLVLIDWYPQITYMTGMLPGNKNIRAYLAQRHHQ